MERSDRELIEAYQNGESAALEALVRRYSGPLYTFVVRLVGDAHDAEDIAQIAFVNLWRHLEKFDTSRSFRTWAFAVARNAAIDHLRKKKMLKFSDLDRRIEDGDSFEASVPADDLSAEEEFIRRESGEAVHRALETLSPDERAVIALHVEDEATFEEIGAILGKSANTVKSRYRRALEKLRVTLHRSSSETRTKE